MVQVYSESSSSLTVQLYSRSRFLMLPLMNRLNIFSENRFSASRTRTINSRPPCEWISHRPQSPILYATSIHGFTRRDDHHCRPVKFFCSGPELREAISKDACIQIQRQLSRGGYVCLWQSRGLTLTIHCRHLSKVGGIQWQLTSKGTNGSGWYFLCTSTYNIAFLTPSFLLTYNYSHAEWSHVGEMSGHIPVFHLFFRASGWCCTDKMQQTIWNALEAQNVSFGLICFFIGYLKMNK